MYMSRTYLIDVVIRGQPLGVTEGDEPVIAATRMAIEVPDMLDGKERAHAIGEQVRKMGTHFLNQSEQLGVSLDRYEAAMEEERDWSDMPPEFRPN
jgi:hypothetical protein